MVEQAAERGAELIMTVDNGVSSISGVAAAKERGIQVLVTDHHLPGDTLPQADAIVNPNLHECDFPSKALCGVGVAFYLMLAVRASLREDNWFCRAGAAGTEFGRVIGFGRIGHCRRCSGIGW